VLDRLDAGELADAVIEREGARLMLRVDRYSEEPSVVEEPDSIEEQLELFAVAENGGGVLEAPTLAPLAEVPRPPVHRVRRLSYSALSLFEQCSYRYFAERVVGLRPREAAGSVPGFEGLAATEIGDAVHSLLERVDLGAPEVPADLAELVRARYPAATDEEVERIRAFVAAYCDSELAKRITGLEGAAAERPFAFEHDGVLLHGRLDVLQLDGHRALVVDYKTNWLEEEASLAMPTDEAEAALPARPYPGTPAEVVERDYRLQRLVYALACFRCGVEEVEVVYQFLERPDELVTSCYKVSEAPALERELSAAIAAINAGEFRPTPSEFACAECPALDLVCAGPRLRNRG
jgi:ATP-dependent helicase/nuclease subunit A